ncbi:MAG: hypothetical protein HQL31_14460 [Planctomycetes bacterium]|nr:hypothetical protein [Planctomycetota bacterium]
MSVVVVGKIRNEAYSSQMAHSSENSEYVEHDWLKETTGNNVPELKKHIALAVGIANLDLISLIQRPMVLEGTPTQPSSFSIFLQSIEWPLVLAFILTLLAAIMLLSMIKKAQPEEEILEMPDYEEAKAKADLEPLKEPEMDARQLQIESRVKELIDENPAKAASLIKNWLAKD